MNSCQVSAVAMAFHQATPLQRAECQWESVHAVEKLKVTLKPFLLSTLLPTYRNV